MSDEKITNADIELEANANRYIKQFEEHGQKAESLYEMFIPAFNVAVAKSKNMLTAGGNLRDLAEAVKSLSGIRGDSISATSHAFNATMKLADFKVKKDKDAKEGDEFNSAALLMRQLTESIHSQNTNNKKSNILTPTKSDDDQLNARFSKDIGSGRLKINVNELSMKHDYNGVTYRYDMNNETMVVIDGNGNKIENYPLQRIPEEHLYKRTENGIPYDATGRELKTYTE